MKDIIAKIIFLNIMLSCNLQIWSQTFIPGNIYYDSTGYIEYRAGNLPIIISAPHGGALQPIDIPDRSCTGCVTVKDSHTKTISEGLYESIFEQTGCYPHVIINLLHRKKFDANRDIGDAADGDPTAESAWFSYHQFIDSAKQQVISDYGRGLFLDIHGHAHSIQRVELGYLLTASELQLSDSIINSGSFEDKTSIRTLAGNNLQNYSQSSLLRGQHSFGTLLDDIGFPAVPSFSDPFPQAGQSYFSGGYNTVRHGSRDNNGPIDAIQIELNQDVRFVDSIRAVLIDSLSFTALNYINLHYYDQFLTNSCNLILTNSYLFSKPENKYVFPNPALNYINIGGSYQKIEIYNLLGQPIFIGGPTNSSRIDIAFLRKGTYVLQLYESNSKIHFLKLIKQ